MGGESGWSPARCWWVAVGGLPGLRRQDGHSTHRNGSALRMEVRQCTRPYSGLEAAACSRECSAGPRSSSRSCSRHWSTREQISEASELQGGRSQLPRPCVLLPLFLGGPRAQGATGQSWQHSIGWANCYMHTQLWAWHDQDPHEVFQDPARGAHVDPLLKTRSLSTPPVPPHLDCSGYLGEQIRTPQGVPLQQGCGGSWWGIRAGRQMGW